MTSLMSRAQARGLSATRVVRGRDRSLAAFRAVLLVMAGVLIAVSGNFPRLIPAFAAMATLSLVASLQTRFFRTSAAAVAEGLAVIAIATAPEPASGNLMLCLLAPALAAGIRGGYRWVLVTVSAVTAMGIGMILRTPSDFDGQSLIDLFQWAVLALALGITAAWYVTQQSRQDPVEQSYEDAVRALTDLSVISRRLPTGLDVRAIAGRTLEDSLRASGALRGVLVTRGYRGSFDTAAAVPEGTADWINRVGALSDWIALAERGEPARRTTADGVVCMVPVQVGGSLIAMVLLQSDTMPNQRQSDELVDVVGRSSAPIQAALLFADVRDFATSEERSRIAREIHDGIAQDIAFLGYAADEIVECAQDEATRTLASDLRREISRVVGDLRMSVFSLREGVSSSESLGAALSSHARRVFEDSNTDVHITISESPHRLRPDVESELLRMAQEALTNARRHANARNVWVTCSVDAPTASVAVADDGGGLGSGRPDSFGLQIMKERAARISADLRVEKRDGGGTAVEIVL